MPFRFSSLKALTSDELHNAALLALKDELGFEKPNNQYAIIDANGARVDVVRRKGEPVVPPPSGMSAFIDPRTEDPSRYLVIDLVDTFLVTPRFGLDPVSYLRADFTIKTLWLNDRHELVEGRREAFHDYHARIVEYVLHYKDAGQESRERARREFQRKRQRGVWLEMKRWLDRLDKLREQVEQAPEVLDW